MAGVAINKHPWGLLGFLGIKNGGRDPETLDTVLSPTINIGPLYFRGNMLTARANSSVSVVGLQTAIFSVPQNEVWAVHGCLVHSQAALGAGVTFGGFAGIALDVPPAFNITTIGDHRVATTGSVWHSKMVFDVQYMPPGSVLGVYCTDIVAGPVSVTAQIWYSRLDT